MRKNIIKVIASVLFAIAAITVMGILAVAFDTFNIIIVALMMIVIIYSIIAIDYNDDEDSSIGVGVINGTGMLAMLLALFFI